MCRSRTPSFRMDASCANAVSTAPLSECARASIMAPSSRCAALFSILTEIFLYFSLTLWPHQDTMMMGADLYETEAEIASMLAEGRVPMGVGQNTKIRCDYITSHWCVILLRYYFFISNLFLNPLSRNCIIDMNARIGKNVIIANKDVSELLAIVSFLFIWFVSAFYLCVFSE